jgi:Ser/Thr protein kinase RdoA (MazF antagonist)
MKDVFMQNKLPGVLHAFGLTPEHYTIEEFGSGLINNTWKIQSRTNGQGYILQRINHDVFKQPDYIAANIQTIASWLRKQAPEYCFIAPLPAPQGNTMYFDNDAGYFRLFPFLENSFSIDTVSSPQQAYEAARQFGLFTRLLAGIDIHSIKVTLPDFHNLSLRYRQFEAALTNGNPQRIEESATLITFLQEQQSIVATYESIQNDPAFHIRVTHHDTKISNVLFDGSGKGLCVIDLDTVMPGYFISDVGDMMRTYLSPVSEEEADYARIAIRDDIFRAIVNGYLGEMGHELTAPEKAHFVYAGKFMIYMQALRFLTDYLQNDQYYKPRYEKHNFVRAGNQVTLLQRLLEKENELNQFVRQQAAAGPVNS